jgi:hypothetical protein
MKHNISHSYLVISSYAANGCSSPATFSLIVLVEAKEGLHWWTVEAQTHFCIIHLQARSIVTLFLLHLEGLRWLEEAIWTVVLSQSPLLISYKMRPSVLISSYYS